MSNSWATGWATNDVVPATEFAKGAGSTHDSTAGGAVASFDFQTIPSVYAHLKLVVMGRSDTASTSTGLRIRFNNDSAANYDVQDIEGAAAATAATEALGQTEGTIGQISAASAAAGLAGASVVEIIAYAGTTFNKIAVAVNSFKIGTASGNVGAREYVTHWRSSAAINRITVFPQTGNFIAGSRATLYVFGA